MLLSNHSVPVIDVVTGHLIFCRLDISYFIRVVWYYNYFGITTIFLFLF